MKKNKKREYVFGIFWWLFIFIVGSLIVSFLISPNSLDSFKSNVEKIIPATIKKEINFNYSQKLPNDLIRSCSALEIGAKSKGISGKEIKKYACTLTCGEYNLEYGKFRCITDKLHCYCLDDNFVSK